MKYVAAYLLAVVGGNANPDSAAVTKVLKAAGVEIDQAKLDKLLNELKGKDLTQLLEEGRTKLNSVPSGGAAPAAAASSGATTAAAEAAPAPAPESSSEEEEMDGFDLF